MASWIFALRIGALLQISFLTLVLLRQRRLGLRVLFCLGLLLGMAAHQIIALLGFHQWPLLVAILTPAAVAVPLLLWLVAQAVFEDQSAWHAQHFWLLLLCQMAAVTSLYAVPRHAVFSPAFSYDPIDRFLLIIPLIYAASYCLHTLWMLYRGREHDLLEPRRRLRVALLIYAALLALIVALLPLLPAQATLRDLLDVVPVLVALLLFCPSILQLDPSFFPAKRTTGEEPTGPTTELEESQNRLLGKMEQLMDEERCYLETDLTVGKLANILEVTQHDLRHLISDHLGYRNFNAFLNPYRVAAAKTILTDPSQSDRRISEIAADLGYRSFTPFYKAFRETTGTTPSFYRLSEGQTQPTSEGVGET